MPDDPASVSSPARLEPARQLVGNNDEVTDLRFVGPPAAASHVAVATNSEQVGSCLCAQSTSAQPSLSRCSLCRTCSIWFAHDYSQTSAWLCCLRRSWFCS